MPGEKELSTQKESFMAEKKNIVPLLEEKLALEEKVQTEELPNSAEKFGRRTKNCERA